MDASASNIKISVIIPVYNRVNELEMTLQSLSRQTLAKDQFEVIVADDGSAEDVQKVLGKFPYLQCKYAFQPDEGFCVASARNMGAQIGFRCDMGVQR